MFTWLSGLILGIGMCIGLVAGSYIGVKWLAPKSPWKLAPVEYKILKSDIFRGVAIKYNKEIYYPSEFINGWLKNKVGVVQRLKGA